MAILFVEDVEAAMHRVVTFLLTKNPEAAVAFEETFIRQACVARGLELLEPIHYGSWCGRSRHLSYQDVLLATKPERPPPV